MLHVYRRLLAGTAVLATMALGIAASGPASAAPPAAPAAPVAAASAPLATFGTASNGVGGGATTQGIDWGNALRTLNSMVECEALIPIYEIRYFPAAIQCFPYKGGTAVMVIVHVGWW
jgi:hypothetical protein